MSKSQRSYCFTAWTEPKFNEEKIRYMIYQKEKCPKTGKEHYQGYAEFFNKITIPTFKRFINDNTAHCEIRKGTREQAKAYCMKSESQIESPKEFGDWNAGGQGARTDLLTVVKAIEEGKTNYELIKEFPEFIRTNFRCINFLRESIEEYNMGEAIKKEFDEFRMNENQEIWKKHLEEQNQRQITWVYDKEGNKGKTYYSRYLVSQGWQRFENAKCSDIAHALNIHSKGFIFDFSRSQENYINYGVIESIKNGMIFSPKYNSCSKLFKIPKIIIFSNFKPDFKAFSSDRWDFIEVQSPVVAG